MFIGEIETDMEFKEREREREKERITLEVETKKKHVISVRTDTVGWTVLRELVNFATLKQDTLNHKIVGCGCLNPLA